MFVVAANVAASIAITSAVDPGVMAMSNKSPPAMMSVCVASVNAPVVLAVILNV